MLRRLTALLMAPWAVSAQDVASLPPAAIEAAAGQLAEAEAQRRATLAVFEAIAKADTRALAGYLNAGASPDLELPYPPPRDFAECFEDKRLRYYVSSEPGFTALMLASGLGHLAHVRMLLAAGATPNKMTRRHKTFALWLAGQYGHVEVMRELLGVGPEHPARLVRVEISLSSQQARILRGAETLLETSVSTGRKSHPTPTGDFVVTNKYRDWKSTIYHVRMPFYLRLSCLDFGLHAGNLPGYPASRGCIRLPAAKARAIFEMIPEGALVSIR